MKIVIEKAADEMGAAAARHTAELLNHAIEVNDCARLILSTGASQFETLKVLVKLDVDWTKVEMFHLDEYVGLPESHVASFRKYLKERFVAQLPTPLKDAYFVNGEGDIKENIARLSEELILWSSWEFHFVRLADAYATGSSIMPQKKNPDMAELARGKTGRVYGDLMAILTTFEGTAPGLQ